MNVMPAASQIRWTDPFFQKSQLINNVTVFKRLLKIRNPGASD